MHLIAPNSFWERLTCIKLNDDCLMFGKFVIGLMTTSGYKLKTKGLKKSAT